MKQLIAKPINTMLSVLALVMISLTSLAQETKKIDVDIDTNPGNDASNFLTQPWVWIVGGAIFILLLVALLRGKSSN